MKSAGENNNTNIVVNKKCPANKYVLGIGNKYTRDKLTKQQYLPLLTPLTNIFRLTISKVSEMEPQDDGRLLLNEQKLQRVFDLWTAVKTMEIAGGLSNCSNGTNKRI